MANLWLSRPDIYLQGMELSAYDKLKIADLITPLVTKGRILDVGCANGAITLAVSKLPQMSNFKFLGIELQERFVELAIQNYATDDVKFKQILLSDMVREVDRFEVVIFLSVLHEIYSYGQEQSSVVKALSHAHELLNDQGIVVIRDMILPEYLKHTDFKLKSILRKIRKSKYVEQLNQFEKHWGKIKNLYQVNHFLLKYLYTENWESELEENYVGNSLEECLTILSSLRMVVKFQHSYLLDYLKERWKTDFGLVELEMVQLRSTTLLVAQKV